MKHMIDRSNNSYEGLDAAKLIAAVLVVAIHTAPLKEIFYLGNFFIVQGVARLAVPFFLLASGFLFFRSMTSREWGFTGLFKFLIRIGFVYVVWSLIYLPIDFDLKNGINLLSIAKYFYRFFFVGSHYHFWYFPALIFATLLLFSWLRWFGLSSLLIFSLCLYLFGLLGDSYWAFGKNSLLRFPIEQWQKYFYTTRNVIFCSAVFFSLGAYVAKKDKINEGRGNLLFGVLFTALFSVESYVTEDFGISRDHNLGVFLVPAAYFLFLVILKWRPLTALPFRNLRDMSLIIYCVHPLVIFMLMRVNSLSDFEFGNLMLSLSTIVISLGLALIIVSSKWKFLRLLY